MPLFARAGSGTHAIYYEDVVVRTEKVIQQMETFCAVQKTPQMKAMFARESISVMGVSDKEGVPLIREGNVAALIGRWRIKVTTEDRYAVSRILACPPRYPYSTTQDRPVYTGKV